MKAELPCFHETPIAGELSHRHREFAYDREPFAGQLRRTNEERDIKRIGVGT